MVKREKLLLVFAIFLLVSVMLTFFIDDSELQYNDYNNINEDLEVSTSLEGIENIIISKIIREANISGFGLLSIEDTLTIENLNSNPISSILFGIPLEVSDNLIFLEAIGEDKNTLLVERSSMVMNDFEIIVAYFDSPLLPYQTKIVKFTHIYKDILTYTMAEDQLIILATTVYPLLPYKIETDEVFCIYRYPDTATSIEGGWGFVNPSFNHVSFGFELLETELPIDYISPFLENLGEYSTAIIFFTDTTKTQLEMTEINRDIFVSPWGIIKVQEEFSLTNIGLIDINNFKISIPSDVINLHIYDYLGDIQGITIQEFSNVKYKTLYFDLYQGNRIRITPNSTYKFNIEYYLPFENYVSINWLQQSIRINLHTTIFEYLGRNQNIDLIIEGCSSINSLTETPLAIKTSRGAQTLTYKSEYVTPNENKMIQLTFTISLFDILLRPIIFILSIVLITSAYVLVIKAKKREIGPDITSEFIPVNEIREFCSLKEEINALTLEIRQSEEEARRKKIAKKTYKNLLTKNTTKIEQIEKELLPFKKVISETNETFENIVKKLDVLEAERISVKDSLILLESRYKRGRLPSRAAYLKLSDDFKKRRRKIDRTIDKLIQQLRSYIL
ncbi:MAG: hypothetical protein ACFE9Z_16065 [Promethearchaeota archaeon]